MIRSEFDEAYEDKRRMRGQILTTPIEELDLRAAVKVQIGTTVAAAVRAMNDHHVGCVLVMEGDRLVGILTERDVLTRVVYHDNERSLRVEQAMTKDPETLDGTSTIAFALNMMSAGGYRHIPILDQEGKVAGTLSVRTIVDFVVELFPDDVYNLPPTPAKGIARSQDGG